MNAQNCGIIQGIIRGIITRNCDTEELQRDPRSERTRLHPSTSFSTPRQCETETNRSSRKLQREPTTFLMLNGGVSSPTSTITKRWTSGKTPQFVTFLAFFTNFPRFLLNLVNKFSSSCFCRLSHDGTISPLESNGLLKSKETVISLDYVRFTIYISLDYVYGSLFIYLWIMYGSLLTSSCNEHVVRAPTHQCPLTRRQMDRPKAVVPEERWEIGGGGCRECEC